MEKINWPEKVILIAEPLITVLRTKWDKIVNGNYMRKNSPYFSTRPKLARNMLTQSSPEMELSIAGHGAGTDQGTGVGRYKKIGGSLEESARGAQRGLLVILAVALAWIAVIWVGYRFFI
ncbi:MAG: hypothetical protein ABI608_04765 [Rhizomicrobium sp.]